MKSLPDRAVLDKNAVILIVDDDPVMRIAVTKVLNSTGYDVIEADSGQRGLDAFYAHCPDLVLLDVMMPDLDGYTVCRTIREQEIHQQVPVIMLTGLNELAATERAFHAGASDFITKPINWLLLDQRLRYAIRSRDLQQKLRKQQKQLSYAHHAAKLGYWELDIANRLVRCSEDLAKLLQFRPTVDGVSDGIDVSVDEYLSMVHPDDRFQVGRIFDDAIDSGQPFNTTHRIVLPSGNERIVHQHGELIDEHRANHTVIAGILQDITERKEAEALIEYQNYYDSLTDLPNRRLFLERLSESLDVAKKYNKLLPVLFIGIDRLKMINDTLGHSAGDHLLKLFSNRLRRVERFGYTLARFAGDTFALLAPGLWEEEPAHRLACDILTMARQAFMTQGHEMFVSASVGLAFYPTAQCSSGAMVQAADTALSAAKQQGGNCVSLYSSEMNERAQNRLSLENDLRKALDENQLEVFYQPQVNLSENKIVGMEALVRWRHPELGLVSPDAFISIAEDTGLIIPIDRWVMATACHQAQAWFDKGLGKLRVGVNLSVKQFTQGTLVRDVERVLADTGLDHACLDLEVTESTAMHSFDEGVATLNALQQLGVRTSIDDFGTGYCSLGYVQRLPVNTLKIDRSFVSGINVKEDGMLAKAIIAMAHSLDLHVIAEGVETDDQYEFLKREGCDEAQGYLISKPVSGEEFEIFLSSFFPAELVESRG